MKKKTSQLKIIDDHFLDARVFRVAELMAGACVQDLCCRCEATGNGWQLTFYESLRNAMCNITPMVAIPTRLFALVAMAMEKAQEIDQRYFETLALRKEVK